MSKPSLFHYHFWTPYLEETEKFYVQHGFTVTQRIGKFNGEFQSFNPPLQWDDFRAEKILFRIIELKKGKVNISIGFGKKVIFDHLGYFVTVEDVEKICERAENLNWKINKGDRRTFISTPYQFRIELQTNRDALEDVKSSLELKSIELTTKKPGLENDLLYLFQLDTTNIKTNTGNELHLNTVEMNDISIGLKDPNNVFLR
ncbi:hypothetical protein [Metabacillus litoralis]|uniref:hypothetical protein n=1 Tax=Metabacillus litoralis TaxID=152268 RepID=UPI001CFF0C24|nr:hypothetical protein [Metabacillus litoralis]